MVVPSAPTDPPHPILKRSLLHLYPLTYPGVCKGVSCLWPSLPSRGGSPGPQDLLVAELHGHFMAHLPSKCVHPLRWRVREQSGSEPRPFPGHEGAAPSIICL